MGAMQRLRDGSEVLIRRLAPQDAPALAEVAVTVVDAWQKRGLGTLLLEQLTERARAEGVQRYTALVAGENRGAVALLESIGAHVLEGETRGGAVAYEVELAPTRLGHSLAAALRAAAVGRMTVPKRIADALSGLLTHQAPPGDR
jgi:Acetyltransferase (GNAT) family